MDAFSFGKVADVLEFVHRIDPAKSGTFRARLKHFQRLSFPPGVNTGKGRAALYGWSEIVLWAVALQLLELGLTPERARSIVLQSQTELLSAAAKTLMPNNLLSWRKDQFLGLELSALESLRFKVEGAKDTIFIGPKKGLEDQLSARDGLMHVPRLAVINLGALMTEIATAAAEIELLGTTKDLLSSVIDWAGSVRQ